MKKTFKSPKRRNVVQQMHIVQNRKAGVHKCRSVYSRKIKHKGKNYAD